MRGQRAEWEAADINVLLLDVHAAPGRDLLDRFGFVSTPTYLVFLSAGQEVYRSGQMPSMSQLQYLFIRP